MIQETESPYSDEFYNIHTHVFTLAHVPNGFLGAGIVPMARKKTVAKGLDWFLRNLNPFKNTDYFERLAVFARAAEYENSRKIFTHMQGFYPRGTRFCTLAVDFEFMGAGKVCDYEIQLQELVELKKDAELGKWIIPFIAIDPRRPKLLELVNKYVDLGFAGLKLYPSMGYFPYDEMLYPVYDFAQKRGIPLIAHCSPGGVYKKGKIDKLVRKELLKKLGLSNEKSPWPFGYSNDRLTDGFTHPGNYLKVLHDFPELKICLGHFGGESEWQKYLNEPWQRTEKQRNVPLNKDFMRKDKSWLAVILDMMLEYPNLYADIAYTAQNPALMPMVSVLVSNPAYRSRILYGSDCYMVQMDKSERAFSVNVRGYLGEDDFRQIAQVNPKEFLALRDERDHESTDIYE